MNDDLLRRVEQVERRLAEIDGFHGRIRAGLAAMLAKITGKQLAHDQQIAAHSGRITALEDWRAELTPAPRGASDTAELNQLRLLRGLIDRHFSVEELRTLAADVGVDFEDLPKNGKSTLSRELIAYMERRGRLGRLVDRCRELRPNMPGWPNLYDEATWL